MEPMDPMKPMQPMKPMEEMQPISRGETWWPQDLGEPAATGAQDGMRYAAFPDRRRLLVETRGSVDTYDTGDHQIGGVMQTADGADRLSFTSQHGLTRLDALTKLD